MPIAYAGSMRWEGTRNQEPGDGHAKELGESHHPTTGRWFLTYLSARQVPTAVIAGGQRLRRSTDALKIVA